MPFPPEKHKVLPGIKGAGPTVVARLAERTVRRHALPFRRQLHWHNRIMQQVCQPDC